MKIVIISDIHSNLAAVEALPERDYDLLWCIGDLVDYGPKPHEVIRWIEDRATVTDPWKSRPCSRVQCRTRVFGAPFQRLAAETLLLHTECLCALEDDGVPEKSSCSKKNSR